MERRKRHLKDECDLDSSLGRIFKRKKNDESKTSENSDDDQETESSDTSVSGDDSNAGKHEAGEAMEEADIFEIWCQVADTVRIRSVLNCT